MAKYHLDEETKGLSLVDLDKFGVDKAEPWRNFSRLLLPKVVQLFSLQDSREQLLQHKHSVWSQFDKSELSSSYFLLIDLGLCKPSCPINWNHFVQTVTPICVRPSTPDFDSKQNRLRSILSKCLPLVQFPSSRSRRRSQSWKDDIAEVSPCYYED